VAGHKNRRRPDPIETTEGWLLFYHGVSFTCNGFVYSFGAVILDINKPWKVLYRTRDYLLTPEKPYETTGFVPNVTFRVRTCMTPTRAESPFITAPQIPARPSRSRRLIN